MDYHYFADQCLNCVKKQFFSGLLKKNLVCWRSDFKQEFVNFITTPTVATTTNCLFELFKLKDYPFKFLRGQSISI
jgi:hypothetical protein